MRSEDQFPQDVQVLRFFTDSFMFRLNPTNRTLDNQLRTRRKVAKMLIAVVIMFSINFFPVHFLPIVQVSHSSKDCFTKFGQVKFPNGGLILSSTQS